MGEDIRYIKPDAQTLGVDVDLYRNRLFWTLQGLVPLAFVGLLLYQRHQQRLEGDVAYARRRRALGAADRRLKRADRLLKEEQWGDFHAEIQRAVLSFLADRMNLAAAGLTQERCARMLAERGVDAELVDAVRDLLVQCDFARFAPAAPARREGEQVRARAGQIIASLEKGI
jgi:hypothetical protein